MSVYVDNYMKTKLRKYGDKVYTNFDVLSVPENGVECESFTIISIDPLFSIKNRYCLQVYLGKCSNKIVNT